MADSPSVKFAVFSSGALEVVKRLFFPVFCDWPSYAMEDFTAKDFEGMSDGWIRPERHFWMGSLVAPCIVCCLSIDWLIDLYSYWNGIAWLACLHVGSSVQPLSIDRCATSHAALVPMYLTFFPSTSLSRAFFWPRDWFPVSTFFPDMIQLITRDNNHCLNLFDDNVLPVLSATDELDIELFSANTGPQQEEKTVALSDFGAYVVKTEEGTVECSQSINQAKPHGAVLLPPPSLTPLDLGHRFAAYPVFPHNFNLNYCTSASSNAYPTENAFPGAATQPTGGISASSLLPEILAQPPAFPCFNVGSVHAALQRTVLSTTGTVHAAPFPSMTTVAEPVQPKSPAITPPFKLNAPVAKVDSNGTTSPPKIAISRFE